MFDPITARALGGRPSATAWLLVASGIASGCVGLAWGGPHVLSLLS